MNLNPYWISGFVDGEGTFYVGINKNHTMKIGYQVLPEFRVVQHKKDIKVLHTLKKFFGCGVVRVNHDDRYEYRVRALDHLENTIIPFFKKHQLMTKKKFDFIKFANIIRLMSQGKHLETGGLQKIIDLAKLMNRQDKFKTINKI